MAAGIRPMANARLCHSAENEKESAVGFFMLFQHAQLQARSEPASRFILIL